MGKVYKYLEAQLKSEEHRVDAENCIKIYNKLKELNDGSVWSSELQVLFEVKFVGHTNIRRIYNPSKIGHVFLKGITDQPK